jgi:hypothetical protein
MVALLLPGALQENLLILFLAEKFVSRALEVLTKAIQAGLEAHELAHILENGRSRGRPAM